MCISTFHSPETWYWESVSGWEEIPLASQWGCNGDREVGRGNQKVCRRCCETRGYDQGGTPEISHYSQEDLKHSQDRMHTNNTYIISLLDFAQFNANIVITGLNNMPCSRSVETYK